MPHNDKWIFYTDLFGRQRWEKLNQAGATVNESTAGFATLQEAMTDAARDGYVAGTPCVPCRLEWRREPVAAREDRSEPVS